MAKTYLFWEPLSDNILQERDESGFLVAEYTAEPSLYGNVINQRRSGMESQFHFDWVGSTLAITNDLQQVTETLEYTAFGQCINTPTDTHDGFRFLGRKGYYHDTVRWQYLARRRLYDSDSMRWLTRDSRLSSYGTNDYVYVRNAPLTFVDPSGEAPASNASLFPFVPGIEVVGASIAPCFRASYSVEFTVPHFVRTGWIIQEIRSELEIVTCEGKDVTTKVDKRHGHYWEAFDISEPPPGLTDTFARAGSLWNTRGFYVAHGMAKGAGNVPLPETFIVGTVPEAGPIPSTYLKPWGWDYLQGAEHSMKITWDCCCKPPCVLMHTDPKWSIDLPVGPDTRPGCPQQVPIYDINEH